MVNFTPVCAIVYNTDHFVFILCVTFCAWCIHYGKNNYIKHLIMKISCQISIITFRKWRRRQHTGCFRQFCLAEYQVLRRVYMLGVFLSKEIIHLTHVHVYTPEITLCLFMTILY